MITAHKENFSECIEELKPLLGEHHEELALNKEKVKLDPDYSRYIKTEQDGNLLFVTLRQSGKIVGYYIGFVVSAIHNKQTTDCHTDIYYIHPSVRGLGAGHILFDFCELELLRCGVVRWLTVSKNHSPAAGFLEKKGFDSIETVLCKVLG